jgi:DNA-binding response OmpR family regulator
MEKKPVVLAIDDYEPILKLIKTNLLMDGYDVVTAPDGTSVLRLLRRYKPNLVILDIMMPGPDGFQVLDKIRQHSQIPVIMLTAKGEKAVLEQALRNGADDYITKPFSVIELSARVKAKLRRTEITARKAATMNN